MTPKSLWTIIIKIFGLYLIWQSATLITQFVSTFSYIGHGSDVGYILFTTAFMFLVVVVIYFLILRYCLFKTEWIIEKIHLEEGFTEEKFDLNIHRSTILSIAVIVLGGIIFIDGLPLMCYRIFAYVQRGDVYKGFTDNPSSPWLVLEILKVIIGYILMTENRMVVNVIERKRKAVSQQPEEE